MSLIFFLILMVFLLLFILMIINILIIEKSLLFYMREENTSYECGFEHNSLSRIPFSVRYFLLTVIFLIFDMEVILLVFLPTSLFSSYTSYIIIISIFFVVILFMGLLYEWVDGSLDWVM